MDNPERQSNFGLLAGNSSNHGIFGISSYFDNLQLPFSACTTCYAKLLLYESNKDWNKAPPIPTCKNCHGFSLEHLFATGSYSEPVFVPSEKLNDINLPGENLFIGPGRLSNTLLIEAFMKARDLFMEGKMSATNVKKYLKVLCFNDKTVDTLINQTRAHQRYALFQSNPEEFSFAEIAEIQFEIDCIGGNPLELLLPPVMLYIINLDNAVETVMHLGMNAAKSCKNMIFGYTKKVCTT